VATDANKTNEKVPEPAADTSGKATEPTSDTSQTTGDARQAAAEPTKQPLTPDLRRTRTFVVGAVVCLAITGIIEWSSRPAAIKEFGKVGQEFYADFADPTLATSLGVYVFDADKVRPLDFRVQRFDNGHWVIPSHHNYPADAEDRLAKTAASIIGIRRGAMVTRWQADHAQFGVVNPKQDTLRVGDVEGVGKRISLRGDADSVLADYIIGNKAEGESDQYYIRHPDEEEVYLAKLDIDLSTKFTDWIQTDLLDVDSWDMTEVTVNDYSFDELRRQVTKREVSAFRRETSSDPWTLDGLNEETEEVDKDAIRETVDAIADLKIVGVRPKQQGLTPDLKLDRQLLKSQRDVDRLQSDLLTRGFLLQPGENGDQEILRLMAREGEMYAATDEGLVYRLHFGRAFVGSQEELEIGFSPNDEDQEDSGDKEASSDESESNTSKDDEAKTASQDEAAESTSSDANANDDSSGGDDKDEDDEPKADDESASDADDDKESGTDDDEKTDSNKPGRYVFVRIEFDKTYLGEEPVKPVEPEQPAELKEPAGPKESDEAKDESPDDVKSEEKSEEDSNNAVSAGESDDAEAENESSDKKEDDPLAEIRQKHEEAQEKYDDDLKEYQRKSTDFDKKGEDGKKKAEELNRRFADWYYVISGDSFDKLRLSRADLVKAKEKKEEEKDEKDQDETKGDSEADFAAENQAAADEFLAGNKSKEGVITTASGLQYKVITEGKGELPKASSTVKVKYKGTLLDATIFDESGDDAVEFGVDQVIKGWTEALQLMKPGAKWRLFIPPGLGYGERGSGDKIGPNALLIFDVELIAFE